MGTRADFDRAVSLLPPNVSKNCEVITQVPVGDLFHIATCQTPRLIPNISKRAGMAEDNTVVRVHTSEFLLGCILGYGGISDMYSRGDIGHSTAYCSGKDKKYSGGFYIYRPKWDFALKPNKKLVFDAEQTGEVWLIPHSADSVAYVAEPVGGLFIGGVSTELNLDKSKEPVSLVSCYLVCRAPVKITANRSLSPGYHKVLYREWYADKRTYIEYVSFTSMAKADWVAIAMRHTTEQSAFESRSTACESLTDAVLRAERVGIDPMVVIAAAKAKEIKEKELETPPPEEPVVEPSTNETAQPPAPPKADTEEAPAPEPTDGESEEVDTPPDIPEQAEGDEPEEPVDADIEVPKEPEKVEKPEGTKEPKKEEPPPAKSTATPPVVDDNEPPPPPTAPTVHTKESFASRGYSWCNTLPYERRTRSVAHEDFRDDLADVLAMGMHGLINVMGVLGRKSLEGLKQLKEAFIEMRVRSTKAAEGNIAKYDGFIERSNTLLKQLEEGKVGKPPKAVYSSPGASNIVIKGVSTVGVVQEIGATIGGVLSGIVLGFVNRNEAIMRVMKDGLMNKISDPDLLVKGIPTPKGFNDGAPNGYSKKLAGLSEYTHGGKLPAGYAIIAYLPKPTLTANFAGISKVFAESELIIGYDASKAVEEDITVQYLGKDDLSKFLKSITESAMACKKSSEELMKRVSKYDEGLKDIGGFARGLSLSNEKDKSATVVELLNANQDLIHNYVEVGLPDVNKLNYRVMEEALAYASANLKVILVKE